MYVYTTDDNVYSLLKSMGKYGYALFVDLKQAFNSIDIKSFSF